MSHSIFSAKNIDYNFKDRFGLTPFMKTSIDLNAKGIHGMTQFMKAWACILYTHCYKMRLLGKFSNTVYYLKARLLMADSIIEKKRRLITTPN